MFNWSKTSWQNNINVTLAQQYYEDIIDIESNDNQALKSSVVNNYEKIFYTNIKSINNINSDKNRNKLFQEITNKKYKLIVLDEIQEINEWTNFLQAAIDLNPNPRFIISASNTSSLNHEMMVGRINTFYIQPLLFNEYLTLWNKKDNDHEIEKYLKFGSFPKNPNYDDCEIQYKEIIESSIINKILIDDFKNKIDFNKFKTLLFKLNNYIGNEINASEIEKNIKIARQTIPEYIKLMHQSRLIHIINKFNDTNNNRKYKVYYEDKSMIYFFNNFDKLNNNEIGALVENIVFNYLTYFFQNTITLDKINYYRNSENKEIDFVLKKQKILIECKYRENIDIDNITNELNQRIQNEKTFSDYQKIIITKNFNLKNHNGWEFIKLNDFLRKTLWH